MESSNVMDLTKEDTWQPAKEKKYKKKERNKKCVSNTSPSKDDKEEDLTDDIFITKSREIVKVSLTGLGDVPIGHDLAVLDRGNNLFMCPDGKGEHGKEDQNINPLFPEGEISEENIFSIPTLQDEQRNSENKYVQSVGSGGILVSKKIEQETQSGKYRQMSESVINGKSSGSQSVFTRFKKPEKISACTPEEEFRRSLEACPWRVIYVKPATISFDTTRMSPTLTVGSVEEENTKEQRRTEHMKRDVYRQVRKETNTWSTSSSKDNTRDIHRYGFTSPVAPASSPSSVSSLSTDTDTMYMNETGLGDEPSNGKLTTTSSDMIVEPGFVVIQGDFLPKSVPPSRCQLVEDSHPSGYVSPKLNEQ